MKGDRQYEFISNNARLFYFYADKIQTLICKQQSGYKDSAANLHPLEAVVLYLPSLVSVFTDNCEFRPFKFQSNYIIHV